PGAGGRSAASGRTRRGPRAARGRGRGPRRARGPRIRWQPAGYSSWIPEAIGRPARTRTWNMRFWRPPLYHWSYWPKPRLLRLLVLGVLAATGAELGQDQLVGHGPLVLGGRVVPLLAHGALERDDGPVHLCLRLRLRPRRR